jgi:hypothetical protein
MLTSGQKPVPSPGRARTERHGPDATFDDDQHEKRDADELAREQVGDDVVSDAERPRAEEPAEADGQAADRGPPHPMDRKLLEEVFERVHAQGEQRREAAREQAAPDAGGDGMPVQRARVIRYGEEWTGSQQVGADERCGRARERHRDEAARLPLEEQQLDGEQRRGHGRAERRGHPGGGPGHEQRLALGARQVEELRNDRSECAARHDDRALGAERAARSDRDGARQRLEQRDARLHAAALDEDGLDGLRDAVAADAIGAVAGHQPDDDPAGDGHEHRSPPEVARRGRDHLGAPPVEVEEVREEADEPQQPERHVRREDADRDCEEGDRDDARRCREVAEPSTVPLHRRMGSH